MNLFLDELMHYGIIRRSGRYPYGSGENPYQHSGDFLTRVDELKKQNFTYTDENGKTYTGEAAIAKSMGLSTTQLRVQLSLATNERRSELVAEAKALQEKGLNNSEIARKMGYANESSVRSLLNADSEARMNQAMATADILREAVNTKGMIDVGVGVEKELGVSREKLNEALYILELEGYNTFGGRVPQITNPEQQTTLKVLCPPDTPYKVNDNGIKTSSAIYDYENIHTVRDYVSHDGGATFDPKWVYPESMDSSRIHIRYGEDGGKEKDGVIEIRRGVEDLNLGDSHYAQVRILVDGTHYMKGMAVYSDDMPEGVDVIFNTNKNSDTPPLGPKNNTVLKTIKDDPTNPFGSLIKEGIYDPATGDNYHGGQSYYYDSDGKKRLSLINKRAEEGDWGEWADKLPSQFLSKQSKKLAERQLNLAIADRQAEFDEIMSLNNPVVKKQLLKSFADDCDSAAEHLYAAALPRQKYQVILPVSSLKDNEIFAPNYETGETVALVRFPHGGTFEIPILKVNNKQEEARNVIGITAKDAVGINSKVAERLSGADFDGDTVMVIPCNSSRSNVHITSTHALKDLEDFDPKLEYGGKPEGTFKKMQDTQKQMGVISNLITDMTIKGATEPELARAVRHSMVVIDAEKHNLDWKQSEIDNGIAALKRRYQGKVEEDGSYHEGASTIISRAGSEESVPKRQGSPVVNVPGAKMRINGEYVDVYDPSRPTGSLIYKTADDLTYVNKKGKIETRTTRSTKMAETDDAYSLVSDADNPIERLYADYANTLKGFANSARTEWVTSPGLTYSKEAHEKYQEQVKTLDAKLNIALLNKPRERQAQLMANSVVAAKKQANPDMTKAEIKKANQQALAQARAAVGAKKETIKISDIEWEAIQAGAISNSKLTQIVENADIDVLREKAMPRSRQEISPAKQQKIQMMEASGRYSTAEIAQAIGVSSSTVSKYLTGAGS